MAATSAQPEDVLESSERPPGERPAEATLSVGTVLQLQVRGTQPGPRIQASILGYLEGQSILVVSPGAGLAPLDLRLGDEVTVRYLFGRSVYGFLSRVVRVNTSPYMYFHLAYPHKVEKVDVRQAERIAVSVPVRILAEGGELSAEVRDLSERGALIQCRQEIGRRGDAMRLSLELTFGGFRHVLATTATIHSVAADTSGDGGPVFRHGVEFQHLEMNDRVFLRGCVLERLLTQGGSGGPTAPAD